MNSTFGAKHYGLGKGKGNKHFLDFLLFVLWAIIISNIINKWLWNFMYNSSDHPKVENIIGDYSINELQREWELHILSMPKLRK